jgi:hypothetical protein
MCDGWMVGSIRKFDSEDEEEIRYVSLWIWRLDETTNIGLSHFFG